ncbi:MAG: hypothetical protein E7316_08080 [Clostridiales bacterium]|nr:hypothetical protein [Clostridiales bacterium]
MKKLVALVLALALCFTCVSALAAGKLSVTQENTHFITSYSNYYYAYAKVENVGDKAIKVNAGVLEVYNADGDAITSSDYISAYARYLEPGEYTYVRAYEDIEDGQTPDDYSLTITGKAEKDYANQRFATETNLELNVDAGWTTRNYMYATVTNTTDDVLYDLSVVLALLDAEGNILYIDSDDLYTERGLTPGSSMVFRKDIPSNYIEYFEANDLVPATVDAIAYIEVEQ